MTTWATRINDLQALGMTYAEIAEAAGMAPSSVGDLATGRSKSPRGDSAILLHQLHAARMKASSGTPPARRTSAVQGEAAETTGVPVLTSDQREAG